MMNNSVTRRKKDHTKDSVRNVNLSIDSNPEVEVRTKLVKKKRKKRKRDEEPFIITNIKVGSVIAILCVLLYAIYSVTSTVYSAMMSDNVEPDYMNDEGNEYTGGVAETVPKSKIIPNFDVSEHKVNAFTMVESLINEINQLDKEESEGTKSGISEMIDTKNPEKKAMVEAIKTLEEVKQTFVENYGGENAAREIIERGIVTFTKSSSSSTQSADPYSNVRNLAKRIFKAKNEQRTFKVSFAGSSAVAGDGNYLKQTFPSVLVDLLGETMKVLGIELEVRNAGIADIASFPYGWCLDNFMGEAADVVSWDSSFLSRGDTDAAFESYLRRVVNLDSSPMLIIREGVYSESKRQILQKYVDNGNLVDPVLININAAAEPFLDLHEDVIPTGFKDWLEFGAPDGSSGKARSGRIIRLSVKQHELVAWLISLHFITAIELSAARVLAVDDERNDWLKEEPTQNELILPTPQTEIQKEDLDLMFGEPTDEELGINSTQWVMDEIYCRTTFDPIVSGGLEDNVVSGSSSEDLDLLLPRGPMLYNKNWVMALGSEAKLTAYSLQKYDFDYRFQKKAYYGVNPSGTLTIFVPFVQNEKKRRWKLSNLHLFDRKKKPKDSISSIILCEVNEHVGEKQCNMVESMSYMVGGVGTEARIITANGVSYQGKKNCVRLDIPSKAKWTTRKKLEKDMESDSGSPALRKASDNSKQSGISLQIMVEDKFVFWKDGPCSISHVIWQQKRKS